MSLFSFRKWTTCCQGAANFLVYGNCNQVKMFIFIYNRKHLGVYSSKQIVERYLSDLSTSNASDIFLAPTDVILHVYKSNNLSLRLLCAESPHVCSLSQRSINCTCDYNHKTRQFSPQSDTIFYYLHIIHIVTIHTQK